VFETIVIVPPTPWAALTPEVEMFVFISGGRNPLSLKNLL